MRILLTTIAAILAGCTDSPPAVPTRRTGAEAPAVRPASPLRPAPPRAGQPRQGPVNPSRTRGVRITFRNSRGEEVGDEVNIIDLLGNEQEGRVTLSRMKVWSEWEERHRTQAVSRITSLTPPNGDEITRPAAIMLWLRETAGIATDDDQEAAGTEAAEAVAAEEVEAGDSDGIIASKLRVPAWIEYADGDGVIEKRKITIVSLHGWEDDEDGWELDRVEAYCHLRRWHRTFRADRILAVADAEEALAAMDGDAVSRWILDKARDQAPRPKRRRPT